MTAEVTPRTHLARATAASVPEQGGRPSPSSPNRIVRQIDAVDAWITARRAREQALQTPGLSRDQRMDVAREVEVLRRTHDAIKGRCARGLGADAGPMRSPAVTAVVAHRHAWFVDKMAMLLGSQGVAVLVCTDNGAEVLGAIVAEQPDLVLLGDCLAMMPGGAVLAEARRYAPGALLAVQASDQEQADVLQPGVDAVFLRHHPPALVADELIALHRMSTGLLSTA